MTNLFVMYYFVYFPVSNDITTALYKIKVNKESNLQPKQNVDEKHLKNMYVISDLLTNDLNLS